MPPLVQVMAWRRIGWFWTNGDPAHLSVIIFPQQAKKHCKTSHTNCLHSTVFPLYVIYVYIYSYISHTYCLRVCCALLCFVFIFDISSHDIYKMIRWTLVYCEINLVCKSFVRKYNATSCASALIPESKVHGAKMGPTWGRQNPSGPQSLPINQCEHTSAHALVVFILFYIRRLLTKLYVYTVYIGMFWYNVQL